MSAVRHVRAKEGHRHRALAMILVAALAVRVLIMVQVDSDDFLAIDGHDYLDIGRNIAVGNGFAVSEYRWFEPVPAGAASIHPDLHRPPLLPLMGAGLCLLPGDWFIWARLVMVFLSIVMVVAVYSLGAMLLRPSAGLFAAALIAFDPFAVFYATTWSTETPFAVFLVVGVAALAWNQRSSNVAALIVAGLSLGLACLARPTGLLITSGLLLFLFVSECRARRIRSAPLIAAMMLLVVAPWAVRNARLTGVANPATFFGPYNLWLGNNPRMHAIYEAGETDSFRLQLEALYALDSRAHIGTMEASGATGVHDANRYWLRRVWEYGRAQPFEAADTILHRFIHFFRPWPNRAVARLFDFWASLLWGSTVSLLALGSLLRRSEERRVLLLLPIFLGLAAALPFIFQLRFRFPVFDAYAAILAAPSGLAILQWWSRRWSLGLRSQSNGGRGSSSSHPTSLLRMPMHLL